MEARPRQGPTSTSLLNLPVDDEWGEQGRRLRFLRKMDLFRGLSRDRLVSIVLAMKPVNAVTGSIICREGEAADQFFLIETGTLVVTVDAGGEARELARLGPGQFFGEIALVGPGRRTATVRAETSARLWSLSASDFQELLKREPDLDEAIRRTAQAREAASGRSLFEVENRNLAVLAEGKPQIRIGRGGDNDLVFPSRLVSRHHAVVERSGDGFRIRDLGSANGTFVNKVRVRQAELQDGAEIWVGDERFIFDRRQIRRCIEPHGLRIDVADLVREVKGGKRLLQGITLSVLPGEFVALVGGSGAGKTTLLDAVSGVHRATSGSILYNGRDYYEDQAFFRNSLGYVPQDDIIHRDLPLRRTLTYAAKLRLPPDTPAQDLDAAVNETLQELGLTAQESLRVGTLSGGQRKRASIGVELLTRPRIFFLDEPTSGLDPATDAQMMRLLRRLADEGSTVMLTTHATKNVMLCDKIIFLARGGHLAFAGTPRRALTYFECEEFDEIYARLEDEASPAEWAERFRASEDYAELVRNQPKPAEAGPQAPRHAEGSRGGPAESLRQLWILSRRNFDLYAQFLPNLMPLIMEPIAITLLLLALFNPGAFRLNAANPATAVQIVFFLTFASIFFGISYGLQEICKEFPIFYRERLVNLQILPYVLSKVAVLAPILVLVEIFLLGGLRVAGRLPDASLADYGRLLVTLVATAFAALAIALFGSAVVKRPDQAQILQPILIIPQVLFSGAILAVPAMGFVARLISNIVVARWSFEAIGQILDLNNLFSNGSSRLGPPLRAQFVDTFTRNPIVNWAILGAFILVFLAGACAVLQAKSRT